MDATEQLEKIHMLELKIALEIKRICDKNGIRYFLTAGTLLGAVRHGGFIPWDDDMDIGMLRSDYNRFVEACKTDLGDDFFLQTWDTDPEYPFSFGKVRLKGTHFVECFSEKCGANNGIFVDVFPFDSVPDLKLKKLLQAERYFVFKRLLWIKKGMGQNMKTAGLKEKIKYYVFRFFSLFCNYKLVKKHFLKAQTKYNDMKTEKVVADGSYSYGKESINRKWTEDLEYVKFETEEFLTYKNKTEYLEYFYGDYMQLPPLEKRDRHMLMDVDFGSY